LEHAGGYSQEEALRVAKTLLPDIVRFDPTRAASYPASGRTLTDDVLDYFLNILTNGKVTTDGVGAHSDLLTVFSIFGAAAQGRCCAVSVLATLMNPESADVTLVALDLCGQGGSGTRNGATSSPMRQAARRKSPLPSAAASAGL
jgi:hypothetical protein